MGNADDTIKGQTLNADAAKIVSDFASDKELVEEAATMTEKLIDYINKYAKRQGLSMEQVVFATALVTINMRQTCPNGKDWFDECAASAWDYYTKATQ
jgi:acetylornithine/succinyldiaminopimelate/putrescine aminotransferase